MDRKYNYLLVYDDCLDIDDSWDDDQIEQYVTDLAYNCAYKATDILIQHYKDFCFHDNTPLTIACTHADNRQSDAHASN